MSNTRSTYRVETIRGGADSWKSAPGWSDVSKSFALGAYYWEQGYYPSNAIRVVRNADDVVIKEHGGNRTPTIDAVVGARLRSKGDE